MADTHERERQEMERHRRQTRGISSGHLTRAQRWTARSKRPPAVCRTHSQPLPSDKPVAFLLSPGSSAFLRSAHLPGRRLSPTRCGHDQPPSSYARPQPHDALLFLSAACSRSLLSLDPTTGTLILSTPCPLSSSPPPPTSTGSSLLVSRLPFLTTGPAHISTLLWGE